MAEPAPPAAPQITGFGYVRPLGSGGFAHVYLYEQDMPRRVVAVKVLEGGLHTPRDRSDFEAEADAMARLSSHPSIVSVWDAGISADGKPYIAMEYCPDSMRDRTRGAPARLDAVLDAGVRLAGALETAHRAEVLHRDIKPSNVLIATTGRPALADFGISMLRGRGSSEDKARAMSIPWAAPEVVSNATTGTVASEIWALGATLYTFAAGRSPFERADRTLNTQAKMVARIMKAKYTPVPGAQGYAPFDAAMARAMSLRPEERFASMRELAEALQQLQRQYGFDVTPLDLVDTGWVTPAAPAVGTRTPAAPAVRQTSRAQQRAERRAAELPQDRDGVIRDRPASPMTAGLIGAGIAVLAIAGLAGVALLAGWIG
ncbi:MAG: serine/threonine-protein kinase [Leucobacter sp.]